MSTFEIEITETVAVRKVYTVEADDYGSALEKALMGDTVSETEVGTPEVIDRNAL